MDQKRLPEHLAQRFCRLNFTDRKYIESLTASLLQLSTQSPGKEPEKTAHFHNKAAPANPRKV